MHSKNFVSFFHQLRRLGGHIVITQFKRQKPQSKWLSSFTAVSFTFFSAFPAVPNQVPVLIESNEIVEEISVENDALLCELKKEQTELMLLEKEAIKLEKETRCTPQIAQATKEEPFEDSVSAETKLLEANISEIVAGYPMEAMVPSIIQKEKDIAGLLVGIAKKESNLGKHSPSKNGEDCYNYWGYKGEAGRGTAMGYACFASPEEAVETVGDRLERLVVARASSEPASLVTTWKCGASCAGHSKESVQSWIGSVNQYYSKIVRSS